MVPGRQQWHVRICLKKWSPSKNITMVDRTGVIFRGEKFKSMEI